MEYVIGIDSGGTHYRILACSLSGEKLGEHHGETASHYYLEIPEMLARINTYVDKCLAQFGGKREDCRYLVCGTTGLDSPEDAKILHETYGQLQGFSCPMDIMNDAELAHYTVTGGEGVLVISGTGSIAYGKRGDGKEARVGGWLFSILGEEGSGLWVTKMALRHLARWFDGLAPKGEMVTQLLAHLNIQTKKQLNQLAVDMATPPWPAPQLGEMVNKAAALGDGAALEILQKAAEETYLLTCEIVQVLQLEAERADFAIGLWGSNLLKSDIHMHEYKKRIEARFPKARILLPQRSATWGAISLALSRHQAGAKQ